MPNSSAPEEEMSETNRQLSRLVRRTGGFYNLADVSTVVRRARSEALQDGAVFITTWIALLYQYSFNKVC